MRKRLILGAVVVALLLSVSGCARKYSAERDGKKLGEAICDLRGATSKEEAQNAVDDIKNQTGDLARKYTMFTAQDRRAIDGNLADLAEHSLQGNGALMQQDLAVLQRNIKQIRSEVNEVDAAAWDGIQEGLQSCTE